MDRSEPLNIYVYKRISVFFKLADLLCVAVVLNCMVENVCLPYERSTIEFLMSDHAPRNVHAWFPRAHRGVVAHVEAQPSNWQVVHV